MTQFPITVKTARVSFQHMYPESAETIVKLQIFLALLQLHSSSLSRFRGRTVTAPKRDSFQLGHLFWDVSVSIYISSLIACFI